MVKDDKEQQTQLENTLLNLVLLDMVRFWLETVLVMLILSFLNREK